MQGPTAAEWQTALAVLDQALDLSADQRQLLLADLGQTDPAAAQLVADLLESDRVTGPGSELPELASLAQHQPSLAGRTIGAYTLVRPLGRGGAGSVWLARRTDGRFEGEAAVKLLHLSLVDPIGGERFRREASTLARLTHPNIARLSDAGVAETGQPYLILEHVEGQRIDQFADAQRLGPRERISLFGQVLSAVAHAHANLVVHRDLKPSNILVTTAGSVKLLDFGIAKLLPTGDAGAAATDLTGQGGLPFTPEYAAPEQVEGGAITTATDVYALGVVLFLLLSGRHPTGEAGFTTAEHLRATTEREPLLLSRAVTEACSLASDTSLQRLRHAYAGDLDNILARALAREPERRYRTVAEFAEDLDRSLRHEPVRARPASGGYRFRKFARRNWVAVGSAAAMTLFLTGGIAVTWRQNVEVTRQRDTARVERAQAQYQLRRATASSNFMQAFLSTVPATEKGLRLEDLLAQARVLLATGYRDDDRFRARMLLELSEQYRLRELQQEERDLVREALGLASAAGDDDVAAQAECRLALLPGESDSVLLAQAAARLARSSGGDTRTSVYCHLAQAQHIGGTDAQGAEARIMLAIQAAELGGDTVSQAMALALNRLRQRLSATTVGRTREALAVARREVALLDALGLAATRQAIRARIAVVGHLGNLGEVQAAAAVYAGVDSFAPRLDSLLQGALNLAGVRIALKLGRFEPYISAMKKHRSAAARAGLHLHERYYGALISLSLSDSGAIADARVAIGHAKEGEALEPATRDGRLLGSMLNVAEGALAEAEGRYGDALRWYREELASIALPGSIFPDEQLTYRAARAALGNHDGAVADSFAIATLRLLREAQHDETRSADVGQALLVRARARLALGDATGAGALAQAALVPLANGFGGDHRETRAAVRFADSLRVVVSVTRL